MEIEIDFHIPSREEFCEGCQIYNEKEKRGPIYFEAFSIVQGNWGNPVFMAKGIQRLIRSWNRFYANFDLNALSDCLRRNFGILDSFRGRNIGSLSDGDSEIIQKLFLEFLEALRRTRDKSKSPVSVAKALSLLGTHFFPLWDSNIAFAYNCFYLADLSFIPYIKFCYKMKIMAEIVGAFVPINDDRSVLKRIDDYSYSKYTKHWIRR